VRNRNDAMIRLSKYAHDVRYRLRVIESYYSILGGLSNPKLVSQPLGYSVISIRRQAVISLFSVNNQYLIMSGFI